MLLIHPIKNNFSRNGVEPLSSNYQIDLITPYKKFIKLKSFNFSLEVKHFKKMIYKSYFSVMLRSKIIQNISYKIAI